MNALVVTLLAIVAVLLFYRFVERKHKILVAKIIVAILVLAGAGVGAILWFQHSREEAKATFLESVTVEFQESADIAGQVLAQLRTVGRADTVQALNFRMCNNWESSVERVVFEPKTFSRGRSTPHDMVVQPPFRIGLPSRDRVPNRLVSDIILAPLECTSLRWTDGEYLVMDSVQITVLEVVPVTP